MKKIMKNRKAFSLIELLAVVIIMGILLLIGVISVTEYISESRKDTYLTNARLHVDAARRMYGAETLSQMPNDGEALLVPLAITDTDRENKGLKSPYGDLNVERSYVVIVNNDDKRFYYVVAIDEAGYAIKGIVEDELARNSITTEHAENTYPTISEVRDGDKSVTLDGVEYKVSPRNDPNANTVLLASDELQTKILITKINPDTNEESEWVSGEWARKLKITLTSDIKNGIPQKFQWYVDGEWKDFCSNGRENTCTKEITGDYDKNIKFRTANITGEVISPDTDLYPIKLDGTKPECVLELDGTIGENNWYTSDVVTVKFSSATDNISGVLYNGFDGSAAKEKNITGNHKSITVEAGIQDNAGNSNTCSITFKKNSNKLVLAVSPNGGTYYITEDKDSIDENVRLTITGIWENDLATAQYVLSKDNVTEPTTGWQDFSNGGEVTLTLTGGTNYLWTKVINNAGTRTEPRYSNSYNTGYTIAYDANGGSNAPTKQVKTHNLSITVPTTIPTREGWTFQGWSKTKNSKTVDYASGASYTENKARTLYAVWKRTVTVTFMPNGSSTTQTTRTCEVWNNESNCSITSPAITPTSGFSALGWNTTAGATTSAWTQNTAKNIASSTTYYAITKSDAQITVGFNANGASSIGSTSLSCYRYNGSSTCNITSPTITAASGFSVLGWNTSATATTSAWAVGDAKAFSANATYYAITKSNAQITVGFNANGASAIGSTSLSCYRYNGSSTCNITSPTITAASGFSVLGWNTSASATTSAWAVGDAKAFSANGTYYAITRSTAQITITFNKNNASSISSTSQGCYRYNGAGSCNVKSPTITPPANYSVIGWNTTAGATTSAWNQNTNKEVSTNATYYAILKLEARQLIAAIKGDNTVRTNSTSMPACYNSEGAGLYSTTKTNGGTSYYYRGPVTNNYVSFAGKTWRILRINEDGTSVRLLYNGVTHQNKVFNSSIGTPTSMYYTNSAVKSTIESWYNSNLSSYASYITTGSYCQAAVVSKYYASGRLNFYSQFYAANKSTKLKTCYKCAELWGSEYTTPSPYTDITYKCTTDVSGYGGVSAKIALLTYEDIVFAGGAGEYYCGSTWIGSGQDYQYMTMSPAGVGPHDMKDVRDAFIWEYRTSGRYLVHQLTNESELDIAPVINILGSSLVTGTGTSSDPYVVK